MPADNRLDSQYCRQRTAEQYRWQMRIAKIHKKKFQYFPESKKRGSRKYKTK